MLLVAVVVISVAWSMLALWFDGPRPQLLAGIMAGAIAVTSLLLARIVRPFPRGLLADLCPVMVVVLWWFSIAPSNTRNWTADVARTAHASFHGTKVTIENVRN